MTDKSASQDLRSKIAFFKTKLENPKKEISVKKRQHTPRTEMTTASDMHFGTSTETSAQLTFNSKEEFGFFPTDMEIFQRPMCLLSVKDETILEIETKTAEQIAKIDWPMVVVAIAGLYRTGKSYLMNRLAGSTQGFALGDTIESKTKGIWAWCKIHPKKRNTVLLLLDTEGLGDVDKGDPSYDNKIFTLAILLCNCLVYNMKGVFDQDAVSKLTFVTEMTKNICFRGESSDENYSLNLVLPDFVLCLRDFSLKLWKGEKKISEDEYLEESLAIRKGKDDKFNKPRECIKKYFRVRRCFTFPVPGDGDVLENLDTLPFSELSTKFKNATERFLLHIYSLKPMELLASKPITGQMFTTLVDRYVTAIRHGAIPDVDDAFTAAAKMENSRVSKLAIENFQKQMEQVILPIPSKVLDETWTKAQQTTMDYLLENVVNDTERKCEKHAQMEMDCVWNQLKEQNAEKIQKSCEETLQQIYEASMEKNITKGTYKIVGGYRRFQRDVDKTKTDFMSSFRDYEDHEIMWAWHYFLEQLKSVEGEIIDADDALSEKAKEDERKQNDEKFKQLEEKAKESSAKALEEQRKLLENNYNKLELARQKQLKEQQDKYEELVKSKLEHDKAVKELSSMVAKIEKQNKDLLAEKKTNEEKIDRIVKQCRDLQRENQRIRNAPKKSLCPLS